DQALGESELLAEQNAAKDTLNGRLRASEADLRRSLDETRREIESLLAQLEVAEGERAELASNNEVFDQALAALEQRYKDIVRAHDAALLDAKASRVALAAVRAELAVARTQFPQPAVPSIQPSPTQGRAPLGQDQVAPAGVPSAQPGAAPLGDAPRTSAPSRELAPFPSAAVSQPSASQPSASQPSASQPSVPSVKTSSQSK